MTSFLLCKEFPCPPSVLTLNTSFIVIVMFMRWLDVLSMSYLGSVLIFRRFNKFNIFFISKVLKFFKNLRNSNFWIPCQNLNFLYHGHHTWIFNILKIKYTNYLGKEHGIKLPINCRCKVSYNYALNYFSTWICTIWFIL